ncbi:hypothetical protein EV182_005972 [Spiromyces aspiralis]|uniref:Uncharacterized protein n=1 Tax=Spiromyces aspiralis TaxID=68401 RepID=A0ACC1HD78_9FUNG|nr:hypothetical protein EV182_005972 [Spiromyces aspiralis]
MQRTSWNHWQLRDVVACPKSKSQLYTINRTYVEMYDTEKLRSTRIMSDLTFDPVSLAVSDEYVVVGGQHSELAVASLKNPGRTRIAYIGGSINNYVVFEHQRPHEYRRDSGYIDSDGHYHHHYSDNASSGGDSYHQLRSGNPYRQLTVSSSANSSTAAATTAIGSSNSSTEPRILVCNNDHTVKVVSIPDINVDTEIQFPTAINYGECA